MARMKVLLLVLLWRNGIGSPESVTHELQRIAEQGFGAGFGADHRDRMNTAILWGLVDPTLLGIHRLPYPKVVYDRASGMKDSVRAGCLVFMDLTVTKTFDLLQLINNAFVDASKHHEAKYVVLLAYGDKTVAHLRDVASFFDDVNIVEYAFVVYAPDSGTVGSIGFVKGSQFIAVPSNGPLDGLFAGRLKGRPFRIFAMESRPYAYLTENHILRGVDVEIVHIICDKMNVNLQGALFDPLDLHLIYGALRNRSVDMLLTRRACNADMQLPMIFLYHRYRVQLMMPRLEKNNYNLQFLKPYKPEVWYMFLTLTALAALLNCACWQKVGFNVIMVIVFGSGQQPNRLAAVLSVAIQFLKFILLETYMGQVTSFMIRLRYQAYPRTLEQFFASETLLNEPELLADFIAQLPGDLPTRMHNKLVGAGKPHDPIGYEPGYAYIASEYAAVMMRNGLTIELLFDSSSFYILDEPLQELQMCYFFSSWSTFVNEFAEVLGQLYANGIVTKLMNDAWRLERPIRAVNVSPVLSFADLVPVFLLLCYGWMLGVLFFAIEFALHYVTGKVTRNRRA